MEFSDETRSIVLSLDLNIKLRKKKKAGRIMTAPWFSDGGSCLLPAAWEGAQGTCGCSGCRDPGGELWPSADQARDA